MKTLILMILGVFAYISIAASITNHVQDPKLVEAYHQSLKDTSKYQTTTLHVKELSFSFLLLTDFPLVENLITFKELPGAEFRFGAFKQLLTGYSFNPDDTFTLTSVKVNDSLTCAVSIKSTTNPEMELNIQGLPTPNMSIPCYPVKLAQDQPTAATLDSTTQPTSN